MHERHLLRLSRLPTAKEDPAPRAGHDVAVAALVRAAAEGKAGAWESLVARFTPVVRAAARSFKLTPADVDDVVQATWLAAFRSIRALERPDAIGAWLVVTARRQSLRTIQRSVREQLTDDPPDPPGGEAPSAEAVVIERERTDAVRAAVRRLPRRQRQLLAAMLDAPGASYGTLADRLDMPIGSIGPTRDRGLERLRQDPDVVRLLPPRLAAAE